MDSLTDKVVGGNGPLDSLEFPDICGWLSNAMDISPTAVAIGVFVLIFVVAYFATGGRKKK